MVPSAPFLSSIVRSVSVFLVVPLEFPSSHVWPSAASAVCLSRSASDIKATRSVITPRIKEPQRHRQGVFLPSFVVESGLASRGQWRRSRAPPRPFVSGDLSASPDLMLITLCDLGRIT